MRFRPLAETVLLFLCMLAGSEKLRSSMFSIVVMVLILESLFWVLRKRAPFCNRGDYPVFVDFFERFFRASAAPAALAARPRSTPVHLRAAANRRLASATKLRAQKRKYLFFKNQRGAF